MSASFTVYVKTPEGIATTNYNHLGRTWESLEGDVKERQEHREAQPFWRRLLAWALT